MDVYLKSTHPNSPRIVYALELVKSLDCLQLTPSTLDWFEIVFEQHYWYQSDCREHFVHFNLFFFHNHKRTAYVRLGEFFNAVDCHIEDLEHQAKCSDFTPCDVDAPWDLGDSRPTQTFMQWLTRDLLEDTPAPLYDSDSSFDYDLGSSFDQDDSSFLPGSSRVVRREVVWRDGELVTVTRRDSFSSFYSDDEIEQNIDLCEASIEDSVFHQAPEETPPPVFETVCEVHDAEKVAVTRRLHQPPVNYVVSDRLRFDDEDDFLSVSSARRPTRFDNRHVFDMLDVFGGPALYKSQNADPELDGFESMPDDGRCLWNAFVKIHNRISIRETCLRNVLSAFRLHAKDIIFRNPFMACLFDGSEQNFDSWFAKKSNPGRERDSWADGRVLYVLCKIYDISVVLTHDETDHGTWYGSSTCPPHPAAWIHTYGEHAYVPPVGVGWFSSNANKIRSIESACVKGCHSFPPFAEFEKQQFRYFNRNCSHIISMQRNGSRIMSVQWSGHDNCEVKHICDDCGLSFVALHRGKCFLCNNPGHNYPSWYVPDQDLHIPRTPDVAPVDQPFEANECNNVVARGPCATFLSSTTLIASSKLVCGQKPRKRVVIFNCDELVNLTPIQKQLEELVLPYNLVITTHYFSVQDIKKTRDDIFAMQFDYAILVLHANESRLCINEYGAGIGYERVFSALSAGSNSGVLVYIAGDTKYDPRSTSNCLISEEVHYKVRSQFSHEQLFGTEGFVLSGPCKFSTPHLGALTHYFMHPGRDYALSPTAGSSVPAVDSVVSTTYADEPTDFNDDQRRVVRDEENVEVEFDGERDGIETPGFFDNMRRFCYNLVSDYVGDRVALFTPLIVSTLLSMFSIYRAWDQSYATTDITVAIANFIANLCSLAAAVKVTIPDGLYDIIRNCVTRITGTNANDYASAPRVLLKLSALATLVVSSFFTDVGKVGRIVSLISTVTFTGDLIGDLIKIVGDYLGYDVDGNKEIIEQVNSRLKKCSDILETPVHDWSGTRLDQIVEFSTESKKFIQMTKQVVDGNLIRILAKDIADIDNRVRAIREDNCTRKRKVVPVGLHFFSPKGGVGKTEFCNYLAKKMASMVGGMNSDIYEMQPASEHFPVYRAEHFVHYDEIGSVANLNPSKNPFAQVNNLLSSAAVPMPSAALEGKHQVLKPYVVMFTSNGSFKEVDDGLTAEASKALRSRIKEYEVRDPNWVDGNDRTDQPHRKADFSHLVFVDDDLNELTADQVITEACHQMASNIENYEKLDCVIDKQDAPIMVNGRQLKVPNSLDLGSQDERHVTFVSGHPGVGKSSSIVPMLKKSADIYGMTALVYQSWESLPSELPKESLLILDDFIDLSVESDQKRFCDLYNLLDQTSKIAVISNFGPPISWTCPVMKFNASYKSVPAMVPGILRRLGFDGVNRGSVLRIVATKDWNFEHFSSATFDTALLVNSWHRHDTDSDMPVFTDSLPEISFDAADADLWVTLSSEPALSTVFTLLVKNSSFRLKSFLITRYPFGFDTRRLHVTLKHILKEARNSIPNLKLYANVNGRVYYFDDNVAYVGNVRPVAKINDAVTHIKLPGGDTFPIRDDLMSAVHSGSLPSNFTHNDIRCFVAIRELRDHNDNHWKRLVEKWPQPFSAFCSNFANAIQRRAKFVQKFVTDHPWVMGFIGCCVFLYTIYKWTRPPDVSHEIKVACTDCWHQGYYSDNPTCVGSNHYHDSELDWSDYIDANDYSKGSRHGKRVAKQQAAAKQVRGKRTVRFGGSAPLKLSDTEDHHMHPALHDGRYHMSKRGFSKHKDSIDYEHNGNRYNYSYEHDGDGVRHEHVKMYGANDYSSHKFVDNVVRLHCTSNESTLYGLFINEALVRFPYHLLQRDKNATVEVMENPEFKIVTVYFDLDTDVAYGVPYKNGKKTRYPGMKDLSDKLVNVPMLDNIRTCSIYNTNKASYHNLRFEHHKELKIPVYGEHTATKSAAIIAYGQAQAVKLSYGDCGSLAIANDGGKDYIVGQLSSQYKQRSLGFAFSVPTVEEYNSVVESLNNAKDYSADGILQVVETRAIVHPDCTEQIFADSRFVQKVRPISNNTEYVIDRGLRTIGEVTNPIPYDQSTGKSLIEDGAFEKVFGNLKKPRLSVEQIETDFPHKLKPDMLGNLRAYSVRLDRARDTNYGSGSANDALRNQFISIGRKMGAHWRNKVPISNYEPLTVEDAIWGNSTTPPMDLDTSTGAAFQLVFPGKTKKKHVFGERGVFIGQAGEYARKMIDEQWELMKQGKGFVFPTSGSMKGECLPNDKDWKARMVNVVDPATVVNQRRILYPIQQVFAKIGPESPIQISYNPLTETDGLAKKMLKFSKHYPLDVHGFDWSVWEAVQRGAQEFLSSLVSARNTMRLMLHAMVTILVFAPILIGNALIGKVSSVPSGMCGTSFWDSICMMILIYFAWECAIDNVNSKVEDYYLEVWTYHCGDDTEVDTTEDCIMTGQFIKDILWEKVKMDITGPTKDGREIVSVPLEEVVFASRKFTRVPGYSQFWSGRLKEESMSSAICWSSDTSRPIVHNLLVNMLQEMCLYEDQKYQLFCEISIECGYDIQPISLDEIRSELSQAILNARFRHFGSLSVPVDISVRMPANVGLEKVKKIDYSKVFDKSPMADLKKVTRGVRELVETESPHEWAISPAVETLLTFSEAEYGVRAPLVDTVIYVPIIGSAGFWYDVAHYILEKSDRWIGEVATLEERDGQTKRCRTRNLYRDVAMAVVCSKNECNFAALREVLYNMNPPQSISGRDFASAVQAREAMNSYVKMAITLERHHIISSRENEAGKIVDICWCPSYLSENRKRTIGGKQISHHRCKKCRRIALRLMGKPGQRDRICYECQTGGENIMPPGYFHECNGSCSNANDYVATVNEPARKILMKAMDSDEALVHVKSIEENIDETCVIDWCPAFIRKKSRSWFWSPCPKPEEKHLCVRCNKVCLFLFDHRLCWVCSRRTEEPPIGYYHEKCLMCFNKTFFTEHGKCWRGCRMRNGDCLRCPGCEEPSNHDAVVEHCGACVHLGKIPSPGMKELFCPQGCIKMRQGSVCVRCPGCDKSLPSHDYVLSFCKECMDGDHPPFETIANTSDDDSLYVSGLINAVDLSDKTGSVPVGVSSGTGTQVAPSVSTAAIKPETMNTKVTADANPLAKMAGPKMGESLLNLSGGIDDRHLSQLMIDENLITAVGRKAFIREMKFTTKLSQGAIIYDKKINPWDDTILTAPTKQWADLHTHFTGEISLTLDIASTNMAYGSFKVVYVPATIANEVHLTQATLDLLDPVEISVGSTGSGTINLRFGTDSYVRTAIKRGDESTFGRLVIFMAISAASAFANELVIPIRLSGHGKNSHYFIPSILTKETTIGFTDSSLDIGGCMNGAELIIDGNKNDSTAYKTRPEAESTFTAGPLISTNHLAVVPLYAVIADGTDNAFGMYGAFGKDVIIGAPRSSRNDHLHDMRVYYNTHVRYNSTSKAWEFTEQNKSLVSSLVAGNPPNRIVYSNMTINCHATRGGVWTDRLDNFDFKLGKQVNSYMSYQTSTEIVLDEMDNFTTNYNGFCGAYRGDAGWNRVEDKDMLYPAFRGEFIRMEMSGVPICTKTSTVGNTNTSGWWSVKAINENQPRPSVNNDQYGESVPVSHAQISHMLKFHEYMEKHPGTKSIVTKLVGEDGVCKCEIVRNRDGCFIKNEGLEKYMVLASSLSGYKQEHYSSTVSFPITQAAVPGTFHSRIVKNALVKGRISGVEYTKMLDEFEVMEHLEKPKEIRKKGRHLNNASDYSFTIRSNRVVPTKLKMDTSKFTKNKPLHHRMDNTWRVGSNPTGIEDVDDESGEFQMFPNRAPHPLQELKTASSGIGKPFKSSVPHYTPLAPVQSGSGDGGGGMPLQERQVRSLPSKTQLRNANDKASLAAAAGSALAKGAGNAVGAVGGWIGDYFKHKYNISEGNNDYRNRTDLMKKQWEQDRVMQSRDQQFDRDRMSQSLANNGNSMIGETPY